MTPPLKPVPLLIDRSLRLHHHDGIPRRMVERIQARTCATRVFVPDDAAVRRVNDTALAVPELLAEHQQSARAPSDVTWIELCAASLAKIELRAERSGDAG
jgi:hypothetical protein